MQILELIRQSKGKFFSVSFLRRTPKKDKATGKVVAAAGSRRNMLARIGVRRYIVGANDKKRSEEDAKHNLITVWDIGVFRRAVREGFSREQAGRMAYRRIPLDSVLSLKISGKVYGGDDEHK